MPFESSESDRGKHRSTENTNTKSDAPWPELFFAPPPEHSAADDPPIEEFEQEAEEAEQEAEDLNLSLPFERYDDFLTALYDFTPVISTPYSTSDSVYEATSYYSSDLTLSDSSYYSSIDGLYYGADDSIHPAILSNGPPSIPIHPAEAHFDFGTSDPNPNPFGIFPEDLSTAIQPPTVAHTPLPVHVTPTSEAPDPDRPFICPHCPLSKAETIRMVSCMIGSLYSLASRRSYNMKKHIESKHDKLKPFKCDTCGSEFTRKNDLDRHCRNPGIHRKRMRRRFDPLSHRITANVDPRLTMSAYADPAVDSKPAIDISEDIIDWQEGV